MYRRGRFSKAADMARFLGECDREVFSVRFDEESVPRFHADLRVEGTDPLVLATDFASLAYDGQVASAVLRQIDGRRSVGEIVDRLMGTHEPAMLYYALERPYSDGLFEHLPPPLPPAAGTMPS